MANLISNTNNLNLDDFNESAIKLLDILSDAVEWNMTSMGPHRQAQVEFIKNIKARTDIPEEIKPILIYNAKKILKEYSNQYDVVSYAISLLNNNGSINLDDEWIERFMDGAKEASSDVLKMLWGRLLANECNQHGSIPIRLLYVIKQMDSQHAEAFTKLCSTCIHYQDLDGNERYIPIILGDKSKDGSPIDLYDYSELESLGLISTKFGQGHVFRIANEFHADTKIHYFDNTYDSLVNNNVLHCGHVVFTNAGEALAKIIETEKIDNYIENYFIPYLKRYYKS